MSNKVSDCSSCHKEISLIFISPCKTSPTDNGNLPVQKMRTNFNVPGAIIIGELEAAGYETHYLDLTTEQWNCHRMVGKHLLAYGLSPSDTVDRIADLKVDYVLITSMFSFEYMMVDELVREIRRKLPNVVIILGGIHASIKPEWHFEESNPDFIVIGEGENTIIELIDELTQTVPDISRVCGIAYRDTTGNIIKTKRRGLLKTLDGPWAFEKVLLHNDGSFRYFEKDCRKSPVYVDDHVGEEVATCTLFGSRGCAGACKYCTSTNRTGGKIRHIGSSRLFSYFKKLRQEYNVSVFCNQADTFGIHPDDLKFLKLVKGYRTITGDTSFVMNNPNAFFLEQLFLREKKCGIDLDFLLLLKQAGFNTITIAVETTNQRFNRKTDWSRIKTDAVMELCNALREFEFKSDFYMMYGFPGQTRGEFINDLQFAMSIVPYVDLVTWNALSLLPGTVYYDEYVERAGREKAYRRMLQDGYGCYFVRDEFNLSEVSAQYYQDSLQEFGKSWV